MNLDLFILNLMLRIWTFYFKLASGCYSTLMYVCEPETFCVLKIQEMNIMSACVLNVFNLMYVLHAIFLENFREPFVAVVACTTRVYLVC